MTNEIKATIICMLIVSVALVLIATGGDANMKDEIKEPMPTPTTTESRDAREGNELEPIVAEPKPGDTEYWKGYMENLTEQMEEYNKEHQNDTDFVPAA